MRQVTAFLIIVLLLSSCTVGISKHESGPVYIVQDSTVDPTATDAPEVSVTPTNTLEPTPTDTAEPTPSTIPTTTVPATLAPVQTGGPLASTVPATPTPRPPTAIPLPPPTILNLTADPAELNPGESLTLSWASQGGVRATLKMDKPVYLGFLRDVSPTGSLLVETKSDERHWQKYTLTVWNNRGVSVERSLYVNFRCEHSFFFPIDTMLCPNAAAQSTWAAQQSFEGGTMLWLQDLQGEQRIYVLYNTQRYQSFIDTWTSDQPENDPQITPPAAKYQPIRGFGKVWRENPGVHQGLGWALSPEQGFDTLHQYVSDFEWNNACTYVRLTDGRVVSFCRRNWGYWKVVLQP